MKRIGTIQPLFRTLREAGYQSCDHPREKDRMCMDCGAIRALLGAWSGGHLEFRRLPREYEWDDRI